MLLVPRVLALILFIAAPVFAQDAAVGAAQTPLEEYWSWFLGAKGQPGAFKASAITCGELKDFFNQPGGGPNSWVRGGHRYSASTLMGACVNKELCLGDPQGDLCDLNPKYTLPADAMLPEPSREYRTMLHRDQSAGSKAVRDAFSLYVEGIRRPDPLTNMAKQRAAFWAAATAYALEKDDFRKSVCDEIKFAPNCMDTVRTLSPLALYNLGRGARKL